MSEPKIRLAYLDGLRGLAAFYVFLNHLYLEIEWRLGKTELPPLVQSAIACLVHRRFAVAVFIVLSGYCLMLPARINNQSGILDYFKRRARRILPPYDEYNFLDWAVPWHLGLFSLGMTGALIGFSRRPSLIWLKEKLPWNILCLALVVGLATQRSNWQDDRVWLVDALVGAIVACQLVYCTQFLTTTHNQQRPLILQLLDSYWAVLLGSFSYSLYLVHSPLLGITHLLANTLPVSPVVQLWTFTLLAVPLVLLLTYLYDLAFERRFMHYPTEVLQ